MGSYRPFHFIRVGSVEYPACGLTGQELWQAGFHSWVHIPTVEDS